jgi:serine/threonine-protein kinase
MRKIGKYEIRERIGRGGMGMVFRAHDPVLDRPVAVKVISDDVEVTAELRARFFREAQACAKLSHPNIVTVYDMGEDDGRLYIVMEFLEGEELRHLISQRRPMALEDKVALMVQVCDGLHFAHQRGVIHRDIKPGNIIVLRDGAAKIVDFGIAHVATLGGGLTRTGLVMGTLRYISPEQARGRADHRSDMFSVGSVFYELLAYRPALSGADPMHLLEQLRSEEPPLLTDLDRSIPADLSAVIARAMRKEPAERYADLGQMRADLENVQFRLSSEASEARRRLGRRLERARQLQTELTERIGGDTSSSELPTIDDRARLDTLRAIESQLAEQTQRLEEALDHAEQVAPLLDRGLAHLDARRFDDAQVDLESVLAQMPEHRRAAAALAVAREGAERARRRALVIGRLGEAGAALERGAYRECIDIVAEIFEDATAVDLGDEAGGLRRAAEAAMAAQEAAQREELERQRDRAEAALPMLDEVRGLARDADAAGRAPDAWAPAEAREAEGRAAFARREYVLAAQAFEEAATLYHRAEEAAREAIRHEELQRQRAQAERALQRLLQQQRATRATDAERWSQSLWARAVDKAREGERALTENAFARATELLQEATTLFRRAEESSREAIRQAEIEQRRAEAERARAASVQARDLARRAEADRRASSLWQAAEARDADAERALSDSGYTEAGRLYGQAARLYAESENAGEAARRQEQQEAQHAREEAVRSRSQAETAGAEALARSLWNSAVGRVSEGEAAISDGQYARAIERFLEAQAIYRRAGETADSLRRQQRDEANRAQERATQARSAAVSLDAATRAPDVWRRAEAAMAQAAERAAAGDFIASRDASSAAMELFGEAEEAARDAIHQAEISRDRERAERARSAAAARRAAAEAADAAQRSTSQWLAACERVEAAERAFAEARYPEAAATFEQATARYRDAETAARHAIVQAEHARQREEAERARQGSVTARARASEIDAARRASAQWGDAEGKATEGRAALGRSEHERAAMAFREAAELYALAERVAREQLDAEELRRLQEVAERARDLVERRRVQAHTARAESLAPELWTAAAAKANEGHGAVERAAYREAAQAFTAATGLFRQAEEAARRAAERLEGGVERAAETPDAGGEPTVRTERAPFNDATVLLRPSGDESSALADNTVLVSSAEGVRSGDSAPAIPASSRADAVAPSEASSEFGGAVPDIRSVDRAVDPEESHHRRRSVRTARRRPPALVAGIAVVTVVGALIAWLLFIRGPAGPSPAQLAAERTRSGTEAARINAEKTGAAINAAADWDRGRALESDADRAFLEGRYDVAEKSYATSRTAYEDAARATEALRVRSEAAKATAESARTRALQVKANELAKKTFDEAVDRQRDADAAMDRRLFAAALAAFSDAAQKFGTAATSARAIPSTGTVAITANVPDADVTVGQARIRIGAGAVELRSLSPGRHPVKATREGYKDWTGHVDVVAGERTQLAILFERAPRPVTGSVMISANVAGADVWVGDRKYRLPKQGVEVGPLNPGRYTVKAAQEGYKDWTGQVDVVAGERTQLAILFERAPTTGSVLISANVAGAEVVIGDQKITSRAQGVEVGSLRPGRYVVKATQDGYKDWTGQVDVVAGNRAQLAIFLERAPTRPTTGSVLISANVTGADVSVGKERIQTRTQAVELGALSPGRHAVKATREGYKDWTGHIDIVAGTRAELAILLERLPRPTTGSVLISANVAGADVSIGDQRLKSRTQGVEVGPLNPGRYVVKATQDGYKEWTGQVDIAAGSRAELAILLERLPRPTTGSVVISANVAGADVVIGDQKMKSRAQGVEVGPLNPGRYAVKASQEGYRDWTGHIDIVAGTRVELAILLERLPRPTTGSVLINANISGADVWVGETRIKSANAGVEVGPLSAGRYTVKASRSGYKQWMGQVEIVAGRTVELSITLEKSRPPGHVPF